MEDVNLIWRPVEHVQVRALTLAKSNEKDRLTFVLVFSDALMMSIFSVALQSMLPPLSCGRG